MNTVIIKLSAYNEMTIYRHVMGNIKVSDFLGWLNFNIPAPEALRLLDICECDYQRLMLRKYDRVFNKNHPQSQKQTN